MKNPLKIVTDMSQLAANHKIKRPRMNIWVAGTSITLRVSFKKYPKGLRQEFQAYLEQNQARNKIRQYRIFDDPNHIFCSIVLA